MTDLQPYIIPATILIGFGANMYIQWKTGAGKGQSEATITWKTNAEGFETRLKQVEQEFASFKKTAIEEIKALQAENNKLIGRNEVLQSVQPSKIFENIVASIMEMQTKILGEIKAINEHNSRHSKHDDDRFKLLNESTAENTTFTKENNSLLKKIVTEQFNTRPNSSTMTQPVAS